MKFDYVIKVLENSKYRLDDMFYPKFTKIELKEFDNKINQLKQAIKILKESED